MKPNRAELLKLKRYLPKGFLPVRHIYPRAYCVAKPASGCAVFVYPAIDSQVPGEPEQPGQWGGDILRGSQLCCPVNVGDWVTLVYAISDVCSQTFAIPPVKDPWKLYRKGGAS